MISSLTPLSPFKTDRLTNHCNAILIGVVKHAVKTSAGSSTLCGKLSSSEQAARTIRSSLIGGAGVDGRVGNGGKLEALNAPDGFALRTLPSVSMFSLLLMSLLFFSL